MRRLLITFSLLYALSVSAQNTGENIPFQSRYHMLDSIELFTPLNATKSFTPTAPPIGTIRAIPEWDPAQAVIVSYSGEFGIPYTLIAEMSQDIQVITIVESVSQQNSVTSSYTNNGVNLANCVFIIAPIDSYWSRDYSPWFIMVDKSEIAVIDFPYNRPQRPNDDNLPVVMSTYLGLDMYGINIFHTGGNFMCDGMGGAAMTDLVLDENTSLTENQVDTLFKQFMGITNNYITDDPLGDYIKHIDCWGKFLDVDKILIAEVPVTNSQYSDYEAMATYWANKISPYGNPYQVYRVYEPSGQPYTNSLILNNKVFIPFKPNQTTNNNAALAVYQQAMPGYELYGISYNSWQSTDALHCRTHEVADKHMIYVNHMPYWGGQPILSQYPVTADIYALSGSNVLPDSVWLKYKVNAGSWNQVNMTLQSGNQWTGNIPQQTTGDTVRYFIHASDQSPRSVTHPLIGPSDPHKFFINNLVSIAQPDMPEVLMFPNPANENIFVNMKNCTTGNVSIKVIGALGHVVQTVDEVDACSKLIKLNTSHLDAGSYFVSISADGLQMVKKVVVMH